MLVKVWENLKKLSVETLTFGSCPSSNSCLSLQGNCFLFLPCTGLVMKPIPRQFLFVLTMIRQTRPSTHVFIFNGSHLYPFAAKRKWTPFYSDVPIYVNLVMMFCFQESRTPATLVLHVIIFSTVCVQFNRRYLIFMLEYRCVCSTGSLRHPWRSSEQVWRWADFKVINAWKEMLQNGWYTFHTQYIHSCISLIYKCSTVYLLQPVSDGLT